jgi:hypothetical protein
MNIPKELKHMSFLSLQINEENSTPFLNKSYNLIFYINKFVNPKYHRIFNFNEPTAVAIKIQKWIEECTQSYDEAEVIQINYLTTEIMKKHTTLKKKIMIRIYSIG